MKVLYGWEIKKIENNTVRWIFSMFLKQNLKQQQQQKSNIFFFI